MLLCRTGQHLQETLPSVTAAKGGHTRYWKHWFTYFCNAEICNSGSFCSINTWHRKHFSLTCLILVSLSTFRTWYENQMKFWVIFMQKYIKFQRVHKAALYIKIKCSLLKQLRLIVANFLSCLRGCWWILDMIQNKSNANLKSAEQTQLLALYWSCKNMAKYGPWLLPLATDIIFAHN